MRYRLAYGPQDDILTIHLDKLVSDDMYTFTGENEEADEELGYDGPRPEFVGTLFAVAGIQEITLSRYSVEIRKGEIFSWEDVKIRDVIAILQAHCDPEGGAEEMRAPVLYYYDENHRRREKSYEPKKDPPEKSAS